MSVKKRRRWQKKLWFQCTASIWGPGKRIFLTLLALDVLLHAVIATINVINVFK